MEIEEIIERKAFRGYKLLHLRGASPGTRWQITHFEGGMERHCGFATTEAQACGTIDNWLDEQQTKPTPRFGRGM